MTNIDQKIMEERLRHNMDYSNEIIRLYENRRKHFLEMHIAFMSFFTVAFIFIFHYFKNVGK